MIEVDDDTVANLEIYGLSVRAINMLDVAGIVYVKQLGYFNERLLRRTVNGFDKIYVAELKAALRNYLSGTAVKTVHQCIYAN